MSGCLRCDACGYETTDHAAGSRCPEDDSVLVMVSARAHHPNDKVLGRVLGGDIAVYDVLSQVGGFATVYLGIQSPMEREVVVKVIRDELLKEPGIRERFLQEARLLSQLRDPRIVAVYQYIETDDGLLCMVLERLPGSPLSDLLAGAERLALGRAAGICCEVLAGLSSAHKHGIIHRDLKPSNIIVDASDGVTIIDFGIAKKMADAADPDQHQTQTGHFVGTPAYMTPEQLKTGGDVDARTDVYSVGVMLYRMLSGQLPFEGNLSEMAAAHIYEPIPSLGTGEHAQALDAIIQRAMAKRKADRYGDVQTMRAELLPYVESTSSFEPAAPSNSTVSDRTEASTEARVGTAEHMHGTIATGVGRREDGRSNRRWWPLLVLIVLGAVYVLTSNHGQPPTERSTAKMGAASSDDKVREGQEVRPSTLQEYVDAALPSDAAVVVDASTAEGEQDAQPEEASPADAAVLAPRTRTAKPKKRRPAVRQRRRGATRTPSTTVAPTVAPKTQATETKKQPAAPAKPDFSEEIRDIEAQIRRCRCQAARKVLEKISDSADLHGKWKAKVDACKPRLPGRPCRYTP